MATRTAAPDEAFVREAKAKIEFEEDPHRAAIEDNPQSVSVSFRTWAALLSMSMAFGAPIGLGFTTMAAVVYAIATDLNGTDELAWAVGAWSLSSACSFSIAGPLSDIFGRRIPLLIGQATVILGCILCGAAPNIATFITGETFIGLGAGIVFVSYAGVPEMLPNKWRSLGLGILEAGIAVPWAMISVLFGNVLVKYATWRWTFYIGIIVESISLVGVAVFYWPTARPRGDFDKSRWQQFKEIDFTGLFIVISGVAVFLVGLTWGGQTEPWDSAATIAPIVIGLVAIGIGFGYEFFMAKNPLFPFELFAQFRSYSVLLVVLFVSGMNFNSLAPLLPQGFQYMFTTDGIEIGVLALPNTIVQGIAGALCPMIAHKIGYIKWQFVFAMLLQVMFIAATAGAVYPNKKIAYAFLPAFGMPMFIWVTILAYAIGSLHVRHSRLGVAMGLLGTFRSGGGAVGNAIFNTIFQNRFNAYAGPEIADAALSHGLNATDLAEIIPQTIEYNLGVPGMLVDIPGMTPEIMDALQEAVRNAYGHAFKIVFYCTIPFSVIALLCALLVEDPTQYMTNHVQFAMEERRRDVPKDQEAEVVEETSRDKATQEEAEIQPQ